MVPINFREFQIYGVFLVFLPPVCVRKCVRVNVHVCSGVHVPKRLCIFDIQVVVGEHPGCWSSGTFPLLFEIGSLIHLELHIVRLG